MRRRDDSQGTPARWLGCLALLAVIALTAGPVRTQRAGTVGRTPWGDPDLQGVYTNSNEYATPLERPAAFAGKHLSELLDDDLVRVRQAAQQQAIDGLAPGPRGPDYWWLENLKLERRARPWLVVDPPDGLIPPLTPEGQRRLKTNPVKSSFLGGPFNGPEDLGLLERCISRSVPGSMIPVMYGNTYQLAQAPGYVLITYEIVHEARVIPLDGRPHVGASIRMHMGDPRGHWDGDTLVVETTNFTDAAAYRSARGGGLRVTERFTRVAADRIEWRATIEDRTMWTRPWTIAMPLTLDTHPVMPFECHEHNYGMANILKAARAAERGR
jgi:hypothetical protein